jgi:hypothetical protein
MMISVTACVEQQDTPTSSCVRTTRRAASAFFKKEISRMVGCRSAIKGERHENAFGFVGPLFGALHVLAVAALAFDVTVGRSLADELCDTMGRHGQVVPGVRLEADLNLASKFSGLAAGVLLSRFAHELCDVVGRGPRFHGFKEVA